MYMWIHTFAPLQTDPGHLESFQKLLADNPCVFHACRSPTSLHHHWVLMGHYGLLNNQKGVALGHRILSIVCVSSSVVFSVSVLQWYRLCQFFCGILCVSSSVLFSVSVLLWYSLCQFFSDIVCVSSTVVGEIGASCHFILPNGVESANQTNA